MIANVLIMASVCICNCHQIQFAFIFRYYIIICPPHLRDDGRLNHLGVHTMFICSTSLVLTILAKLVGGAGGTLCVEMGFTWTFLRNQDATVKLKSELISIEF